MAEEHRAPEAGKLCRPWIRGRRDKDRATKRARGWAVQNEMRGVLTHMSAGATRRILDSADPKEIRAQQKAVSVAAKTTANTASVTRKLKFLSENRGNRCVEEFI